MAELALIPWTAIEEAPEWAEAPVYKRDEYLAKWEEQNTSRARLAGADSTVFDRIKSHAAQIRNELYPVTPEATAPAADPLAVAAAAAEDPAAKRKAMFDRITAAREARKPELDAFNAEVETLPEGFKGSVSATYPEGSSEPVVAVKDPKFSPEDPPAVTAFGRLFLDPARPKAALDTAIANKWLGPEDAAEFQEMLPQLEQAAAAKAKWEAAATAAGMNPSALSTEAAAQMFGVSRGGAGIAGAIGGGALVRALMGKNPYVVAAGIVASAAGGFGAGKLHDAAADALGDYISAVGAASAAKGINPEAAAKGELATLVLPLPGSIGKLATGVGMVAREAGPMAAASFAAKNIGAGAGIGAGVSLALQGVESALQGENLFNVDSTAFGAALGAVLSGHNLKFPGYNSGQVVDIMQRGLSYQQQVARIPSGQPVPKNLKPLAPREQAVFDKVLQQMRALDPATDPHTIASEARQVEGFGGVGATEATTTGRIHATQVTPPTATAPATATTVTAPLPASAAPAAPSAAPAVQQAPTPPTPVSAAPAVVSAPIQPTPAAPAATVEAAPVVEAAPPPVETPAAPPVVEAPPVAAEPSKYEGAVISSTAIKNPDGTWVKGPELATPHKELIREHLLAGGSPDTETMLDSMGFEVTLADGSKEWIGRDEAYTIAEKTGQLIEPAKNKRLASEILRAVPQQEPPEPPVDKDAEELPVVQQEAAKVDKAPELPTKPEETTLLPKAENPEDVSIAPPADITPETEVAAPPVTVEPVATDPVFQKAPSEAAPAIKPDKTGNLTGDNHRLMALVDSELGRLERLAEFRGAEDPELAASTAALDVLNSISEADSKDPAKVKSALTNRLSQVVEDQRRKSEAAKRGGKQEDERLDDPENRTNEELQAKTENAQREIAADVAKAMDGLSAKERTLLFQVSDGKTLAEIAKSLGITPQAAEKQWKKVQTKMAAKLADYRRQEGALLLPGGKIGTARIPVPAAPVTAGSVLIEPYMMSKARRKMQRAWIGKHGALPPEMREQLRKAGLSEAEMKDRFSLVTKDLQAAVNAQAGKAESPARQQLLDRLSDYLEGRAGALRTDTPRVQETARRARNSLDDISEMYVLEGGARGALANVIVGNHGAWLRRYYAAFDPESGWTLDNLRQRASRTGPDAAAARKILDDAELFFYRELTAASKPNNPEHIEPLMRAMTDRTQMEAELFGTGGGTGSANISSFLRREKIPPELRALMGEERNPLLRVEKSGAFLSQAITRYRSQQALRQIGLQTGAFSLLRRGRYSTSVSAPDPGRSPFRGLWTTPEFAAAMTEAQLYKPDLQTAEGLLNKLWRSFVGLTKGNLVVFNPRSTMANALGGGIQSIASGVFVPFMPGGVNLFEGAKLAWDAVFRGNGEIDPTAANAAVRERIRHVHSVAMRAGMIDSSVTVGDLERSIGETLALDELDVSERRVDRAKGAAKGAAIGYAGGLVATGSRIGGAVGAVVGGAGGALAGNERVKEFQKASGRFIIGKPDAFWKVLSLVDNFAQGLQRGMNLDDAMNWAADRTRATMPSYDAIPEGLRMVASKIPGVNIFFQFSWELVRNNINNIRLGIEDLADSNPVAKRHGAKRLMGAAMLAGLLYGLYDWQRRKHNWTPEKDRAARRSFLPDWDKKGMILPIKQEGTKVTYVNGRYMAPQLIFAEAVQAATDGKDPLESTGKVVGAIMDDFVRSNAAVDPAIEAFVTGRRTDTGQPITSEKGFAGAMDRFDHFAKRTLAPGFAQEIGKMRMAATGESAGYGRKYTMEERFQGLAGMRANTYDFKDQLGYRLSDMDRAWNEISKNENKEKRKIADMKTASPDAYTSKLKEIQTKADRQRGELQLAAIQLYGDAYEVGIPDDAISAAMNNKGTTLPIDLKLARIARSLRAEGKDPSAMTIKELRAKLPAVKRRVVESVE